MSEKTQRDTPATSERDSAGVLANLPRTRPQRSSARRLAARDGASSGAARRAGAASTDGDGQAASASQPGTNRTSGATKRTSGARKARAAPGSSATPRAGRPASGAAGKRAARQTAATGSARQRTRAPRQGFDSDADSTSGPVMPPGGAEILTAATELIADVAKSGLSRGTSTLKDILQRLHLS